MDIDRIYLPFLRYFRTKRMRTFWRRFGLTHHTRVLDVGGAAFNWSILPDRPQLVLLNLSAPKHRRNNWVVGDGCHLPFVDGAFDVVYSNSVIEHLSSVENQRLFATEVRRAGNRYYVQTPNKRFPVEPHLLAPFIHWLPPSAQTRLLRNFTIRGLVTRPTEEESARFIDELRLLNERELRLLFPDAEIWHERFLGLVKSLIAVKNPS